MAGFDEHKHVSSVPGDNQLEKSFGNIFTRHKGGKLFITVAWARESGVTVLLEALDSNITEVTVVVGLSGALTSIEAIERLRQAGYHVYVAYLGENSIFHPKRYISYSGASGEHSYTALTGSANLTGSGIESSYESWDETFARHNPSYLDSVLKEKSTLLKCPNVVAVDSDKILEQLYNEGLLPGEKSINRRRQRGRQEQGIKKGNLQSSLFPPLVFSDKEKSRKAKKKRYTPVKLPFEIKDTDFDGQFGRTDDISPRKNAHPGKLNLFNTAYAGTLTQTDLNKLKEGASGTFEHDLGITARDQLPEFWGWGNKYKVVTREKSRDEWQTKARVISSKTDPHGEIVDFVLWYRVEREKIKDDKVRKHAAEHRLRPQSIIKDYVPDTFDIKSLIVFERLLNDPQGADFIIRLVASEDPGYEYYQKLIVHHRSRHSFGYGPTLAAYYTAASEVA